nr:hypothetical protein [uncultured Gemmiger sp.]
MPVYRLDGVALPGIGQSQLRGCFTALVDKRFLIIKVQLGRLVGQGVDLTVQQLFNIHGNQHGAQPLHTHILAAQHIAPADKIGVVRIRRQQYKAAGVLSSASVRFARRSSPGSGSAAASRASWLWIEVSTAMLRVIINALDKEVQLLQRFLVELFLKDGQPDMQRRDHQGAAEQRHHRKDADKFLRYRQVKKPFFEAGEHEEKLLCT